MLREIMEGMGSFIGPGKKLAEFIYTEFKMSWRGTWSGGDMTLPEVRFDDARDYAEIIEKKFPKLKGKIKFKDNKTYSYTTITVPEKALKGGY